MNFYLGIINLHTFLTYRLVKAKNEKQAKEKLEKYLNEIEMPFVSTEIQNVIE